MKNILNWYDYGARHYDPMIGHLHVIDPKIEKYATMSPYNYCNINPINAVDPDGKIPVFLIPLAKGFIGATIDAATQVTVSMVNGQGLGEAMSNIDYTNVGASFVTSALTISGMSNAAKDALTSGFNKAVASDLTATSVATMTNETKFGLKQAQSIVNSTSFQTGVNAAGDFVGGLIGGQVSTSVNSTGGNIKPNTSNNTTSTFVQPTDAIDTKKPLYPIIFKR